MIFEFILKVRNFNLLFKKKVDKHEKFVVKSNARISENFGLTCQEVAALIFSTTQRNSVLRPGGLPPRPPPPPRRSLKPPCLSSRRPPKDRDFENTKITKKTIPELVDQRDKRKQVCNRERPL